MLKPNVTAVHTIDQSSALVPWRQLHWRNKHFLSSGRDQSCVSCLKRHSSELALLESHLSLESQSSHLFFWRMGFWGGRSHCVRVVNLISLERWLQAHKSATFHHNERWVREKNRGVAADIRNRCFFYPDGWERPICLQVWKGEGGQGFHTWGPQRTTKSESSAVEIP